MNEFLKVENLSVDFTVKNKLFHAPDILSAVSNVNFSLNKGESFGLAGESGCGKTTLANAILGFIKPNTGKVTFKGKELTNASKEELKNIRRQMQLIFQDPYSSLNPRMEVWRLIGEPLIINGIKREEQVKERAAEVLKMVGLSEEDMSRLPSDFSGGQRQRIVIARALALSPEFIVCDEPLSALDVSVHAQICNLLLDLQQELGLSYLLISHNLTVLRHMTQKMAIMYLGKFVEAGDTEKIFHNPIHPYTKALLSAIPDLNPDSGKSRIILKGDAANPLNPPKGCRFASRCAYYDNRCNGSEVELKEVEENHFAACLKI